MTTSMRCMKLQVAAETSRRLRLAILCDRGLQKQDRGVVGLSGLVLQPAPQVEVAGVEIRQVFIPHLWRPDVGDVVDFIGFCKNLPLLTLSGLFWLVRMCLTALTLDVYPRSLLMALMMVVWLTFLVLGQLAELGGGAGVDAPLEPHQEPHRPLGSRFMSYARPLSSCRTCRRQRRRRRWSSWGNW